MDIAQIEKAQVLGALYKGPLFQQQDNPELPIYPDFYRAVGSQRMGQRAILALRNAPQLPD